MTCNCSTRTGAEAGGGPDISTAPSTSRTAERCCFTSLGGVESVAPLGSSNTSTSLSFFRDPPFEANSPSNAGQEAGRRTDRLPCADREPCTAAVRTIQAMIALAGVMAMGSQRRFCELVARGWSRCTCLLRPSRPRVARTAGQLGAQAQRSHQPDCNSSLEAPATLDVART
jgi:hypothetical protein